MFLGEHQHQLDDKGRLILPARFRKQLEVGGHEELVFAAGQERCIDVFPRTAFEDRVAELRSLPREHQGARAYLRVLLAGAHIEKPDKQGRVGIPERLREYARLEKKVTVNGADTKIEIWDEDAWIAYRDAAEERFASLDAPFAF